MIRLPSYGSTVSVKFDKNDATKKGANSFLSNRFKAFFPSYDQCTLIGSTSMYMVLSGKSKYQKTNANKARSGNHLVCDSFCTAMPKLSKDFKSITISTAVSDGLGYEEDDHQFNQSVAAVSTEFSKRWVSNVFEFNCDSTQLREHLKTISSSASESISDELQKHRPACSLSSGVLQYSKGQWQGRFNNIGDGMIVIISSDCTVKTVIPATVMHRSRGNYSPDGVQELTTRFAEKVKMHDEIVKLDEGDIVLYMTDGAYSGLPLTSTSSMETEKSWGKEYPIFRQTEIIKDELNKILAPLRLKGRFSTYDVSSLILEVQTDKFLEEFNLTKGILKHIQKDVKSNGKLSDSTLRQYLTYLEQKDPTFAKVLLDYLQNAGHHDGVEFDIERAYVSDLHKILETQEYGDCTTISAIRVPSYKYELIKTYLHTRDPKLLEHISLNVSLEEVRDIITSLSTWYCCPISHSGLDGPLLSKVKMQQQFRSEDLKSLQAEIEQYYDEHEIEALSNALLLSSFSSTSNTASKSSTRKNSVPTSTLDHSSNAGEKRNKGK